MVGAGLSTRKRRRGAPAAAGGSGNWATRSQAEGVVRAWALQSSGSSDANLSGTWSETPGLSSAVGVIPGTSTSPTIDATTAPAGMSGSLLFEIPTNSGSNASGNWWGNFSDSKNVLYGAGETFYIQWRQRFNSAMCSVSFQEAGGGAQGGIKQIILSAGDTATKTWSSATNMELVMQTRYQPRIVHMYHSAIEFQSLEEVLGGGSDFDWQNANDTASFCRYSGAPSNSSVSAWGSCFGWVADEWMTFQVAVTLGVRDSGTGDFTNCRVRFWAAREGQVQQLLGDYTSSTVMSQFNPGGTNFRLHAREDSIDQEYGKVWLLPYMTNKSSSQAHATAKTWYSQVIVGTNFHADPVD